MVKAVTLKNKILQPPPLIKVAIFSGYGELTIESQ